MDSFRLERVTRTRTQGADTARPPRAAPKSRTRSLPLWMNRELLTPVQLMSLQASAGNAAVASLIAQRDAAAVAAPPATAPAPAPAAPTKDPVQEAVENTIITIVTAGKPLAGTEGARGISDSILNQVLNPKARKPAKDEPLASFEKVLYGADVLKNLRLITKQKKAARKASQKAVIEGAIGQLLSAADSTVAPKKAMTLDEEFAMVKGFKWFGDITDPYSNVRLGLIATFGGLQVGTQQALNNADAYYSKMTDKTAFLGRYPKVHPDMAARLTLAQKGFDDLAKAKGTALGAAAAEAWFEAAKKTVKGIGGLAIRANVNNTLRLSNHSFGCAIDVAAKYNPNVPDFPTELVEAVTGVNVFVGSSGKQPTGNITTGLTMEQVRVEAERLHKASDQFKAVFQDDNSLKQELVRQATKTVGLPVAATAGDDLFAKTAEVVSDEAAAAAASKKKKKELTATAEAASAALFDYVMTLFGSRTAGTAQAPLADWEEKDLALHMPKARKLVKLLVNLMVTYKSTYITKKTRKGTETVRTESQIIGNTATLAYGGFMNLSEDVVAALAGKEGGGLIWLGGTLGTKDFMHFDLPEPLPRRY